MQWGIRAITTAAVFAAIACSSPQARPPKNVSADRDEPYRLELVDRGGTRAYAEVSAYAPAAGTWWYVVVIEGEPPTPPALTFTTRFYRGKRGLVELALVDERRERVLRTANAEGGVSTIELPRTDMSEVRYLLRVTTKAATSFLVETKMTWTAPPIEEPVAPPLVCKDKCGDYPPCDLNKPDYDNPRCCNAQCSFRRLTCTAKVIGMGRKWGRILIGADKEIMRGARGWLVVLDGRREKHVSDLIVWNVGPEESIVEFLEPDKVNVADLSRARVILRAPDSCGR